MCAPPRVLASAPPPLFLQEFYSFYLGEHSTRGCRRLHVLGTTAALGLLAGGALFAPRLLLAVPLVGYGAAWVGE